MFGKKKRITPTGDVENVDTGPLIEVGDSLADQMGKLASMNARHREDASDKRRGMTLGELDHFVHAAMSQGAHEDTPVMTQVNITGGIKAVWTRENA